jgi:hypothetical protein
VAYGIVLVTLGVGASSAAASTPWATRACLRAAGENVIRVRTPSYKYPEVTHQIDWLLNRDQVETVLFTPDVASASHLADRITRLGLAIGYTKAEVGAMVGHRGNATWLPTTRPWGGTRVSAAKV